MCSAEHESACGYADGTVRAFTHGSGALAWSIPKVRLGFRVYGLGFNLTH
jgi:hypothetical protein